MNDVMASVSSLKFKVAVVVLSIVLKDHYVLNYACRFALEKRCLSLITLDKS